MNEKTQVAFIFSKEGRGFVHQVIIGNAEYEDIVQILEQNNRLDALGK